MTNNSAVTLLDHAWMSYLHTDGSDWLKMGHFRAFSDQISVHFGSPSQNVLKSDLEKVPDLCHGP